MDTYLTIAFTHIYIIYTLLYTTSKRDCRHVTQSESFLDSMVNLLGFQGKNPYDRHYTHQHQNQSLPRSPYLPPPYVSAAMHGGDVLAINLSFFLGRFPFDWNKIGWLTLLGVSALAAIPQG